MPIDSKRPRELREDVNTQKPRKRARYTLIACDACKHKKVKCSGASPCQNCLVSGSACNYAVLQPTVNIWEEFSVNQQRIESKLGAVEEGLSRLTSIISNGLRGPQEESTTRPDSPATPSAALVDGVPSASDTERHHGGVNAQKAAFPTSVGLTMNAIRETLEATKVSTESFRTAEADAHPEARMRDKAVIPPSKLHSAFVEIAALGQETVDRLLAGFEVEYLPLYPFVSLRKARYQARTLFLGSEEATRTRIVDLDILKAILAIQMQFDDGLDCPIKDHLLSHIGWDVGRCAMGDVVGTEDIEICALISLYLFHRDESTKALRMIQFASRLCFDLGLNRAETYRSRAVGAENAQSLGMLFCCVCVLEHRLGFALQTPYLTRYTEIDDEVLDLASSQPLIKAMLVFDRLSAQMYDHVQGRQQTLREADERNYLEYRIQSLEESLPPQLRYHEGLMAPELTLSERVALNLQGMLYIRRNHLKVVLYTRHQTASALGGPPAKSSDQVVEPAKNTIRFCTSLVKTGSMLPALRTSFEYFLASALAAMFLVVARRPDSYGEACRDHFHEAIKVLEGSPARFHAPQENWCTLDDLKRIAKRLSMPMPEPEPTAPERGADYSADRGLSQATIDELLCWTYGDSSQLGLDDFIFLTEGD